ncbi:phosphoribosylformylglycinamidine synthase [Anaerosolibacter carboniphilus]|uniref:Phosphoribosylformylglycinamidine synthase n=1 Tax=Anaerosolibacter carboniphilus TaxID=1417629 RepID=A0A841L2I3_9FIRM|nr:phosphoribosylformylglycinamidine synthase [Anaerosolibacter carboniphilus]MBB6218838.1 phosphoribosylformylglycinamidine synthase [Anaerosolibacter carboniphilus]
MENNVRRIFVEKKKNCAVEAQQLLQALKEDLGIHLENLRIVHRYDVAGISDTEYQVARNTIFSEPPVDHIYDEKLACTEEERIFAIEYLPGQYDQRADSAAQCLQILNQKERPDVQAAKVIVLQGKITEEEFMEIKKYCINPVDSREASLEKPASLEMETVIPEDIAVVKGFNDKSKEALSEYKEHMGFAMSLEDLVFCQDYFKNIEKRNPTVTELKVIDTYWSDHCRHTTFLTEIEEVQIENGAFSEIIAQAHEEYLASRDFVYGDRQKDVSLMDIATMEMKELRKRGQLEDLDVSDEINACSIVVKADVDGQEEDWLVMFKNETHNHPTEIEPFGGAATCLGGAIRDPLSGRTYVYQAMRVTGSGDPRTKIEDTLPGKLPQRKITIGAAAGYSSYGNQIGLATGQVAEIYDEGFVAKRMEIGAVLAAAPKANVVRQEPQAGDVVLLVGGRTGRDGCGGATGSSKEHTEDSILTCGAEVQKGNAPTERKIQRLFRNPAASKIIKKCNDFGAGGVSVAIGELTDGIEVYLDAVPKKYEGLDGTELAISESQERMAVVVSKEDAPRFIDLAQAENLEAVEVAKVTRERRLKMIWKGTVILDISRNFLDTNGIKQKTKVFVKAPDKDRNYFHTYIEKIESQAGDFKKAWLDNLQDLNVCSQKGLVERFDSTIGTGTILMPFGGGYQSTPSEAMVAKLPLMKGETTTGTIMSYGYNPKLCTWSPFHGAFYGVIEAVAKVVALGGDYKGIRLTLQEYFEKLGKDPEKWGKPFSALLGAFYAQKKLGIPAIGGKDSMSGTFKDLNVPPTLVTFAVDVVDVNHVISQEFKGTDNEVIYVPMIRDIHEIPDFERLEQHYSKITRLIRSGKILSSHTVRLGGIAAAISKMCFGNKIGIQLAEDMDWSSLFAPDYGGILLEIDRNADILGELEGLQYQIIGKTQEKQEIVINGIVISLNEAQDAWEKPLEKIFPTKTEGEKEILPTIFYQGKNSMRAKTKVAKPRIFIPIFPGTNCEYDSIRAFEKAGGQVESLIFKNLSAKDIEASIDQMTKQINQAQIVMLPGGFSAGDEPDGSGKFIATAFRNPRVKEAVMQLLKQRDGLMLGICNGFQALIKLGLLPYGEIRDMSEESPTLTYNKIGRHASCMVHTKVVSNLSPWMNGVKVGDIHTIPISHGEGRFIAGIEAMEKLLINGQIATQYVDRQGNPTYEMPYNPNGSMNAVEAITSPDGRILGKMGHSERVGNHIGKNVPGEKDQRIFEAGVAYFRD